MATTTISATGSHASSPTTPTRAAVVDGAERASVPGRWEDGGKAEVPLTSLARGQRAVIRETRMPSDDAALLRAMGLCDCALLTVVRTGEPCIVTVTGVDGADCKCHRTGGCRIGLARAMAERIFVSVLN